MGANPGSNVTETRRLSWFDRLKTWQIGVIAFAPIIGTCACCVLLVVQPGSEFVGPTVQAPEGDFVAQIRENNHGALDTFHASIYVTDESVKSRLFLSGRKTRVFYGNVHPCTVILTWESGNHLIVTHPPPSERRIAREYHPDWPDLTVTFVEEMPDDEQILEAFGVETFAECYSTYFQEGFFRKLSDRLADIYFQ